MKAGVPLVVGFVALLVAGSVVGAAPAAAVTDDGTTIESLRYGGQSVVSTPSAPLYVWQSDRHEFTLDVSTNRTVEDASVCLLANSSGSGPYDLACRTVSLDAGSDRTITLTIEEWPANLTGPRTFGAVVRDRPTGDRLAGKFQSLIAIERDGDLDEDGLSNEREIAAGTALNEADTDGDGLRDDIEVLTYDTSPTDADTDSDGLEDGTEVSVYHTDPTDDDTDGDDLTDGREVELGTVPTVADTDGDGLADGAEATRYQTNATLADTDGDGLADGAEVNEYETDPQEPDTDGDGLDDGAEVHVHGTDPARADTDEDGLTDRAEIREHRTDPTDADSDGDGLTDADEVHEYETDPLTADTDGDGLRDGREIELGSDPTDPASAAQPSITQQALWVVEDHPILVGSGVAAVLLLTAVGIARRRGHRPFARPAGAEGDAASDTPTESTVEKSPVGPVADESTPDGPSVDAEEQSASAPDLSIMTNEERVAHLLDERDGRMLQSDMVEAADWSKATVSRVLSRMEEDGTISRVDIGKGNLVTRPEDEPASAESPFSE